MADENPRGWRLLPKESFNKKALRKRMRKVEGTAVRHAHKFVVKRWSSLRNARRKITIWVLAIGIIIGAAGMQAVWYQGGYRTTAAATEGTYAEAVLGPVNTLNPLLASTSAEQSASKLIFSSLLRYDDTGHINNDLATNVSISSDRKVYTVSIRPDALWQDGQPVTANDVVFTVGLLKNPAVHSTISGWDNIQVVATDKTTVQFTLPAPYAAFAQALTFPVVPEHLLRDVAPASIAESSFSSHPVGSGPFSFQFLQDEPGNANEKNIHLVRNAHYYGGVAKIDRFQLNAYASSDNILHALSTTEVNAATDIPMTLIHKVNHKHYNVETKPINSGVYALFNMQSTMLKDHAVRQALQLATNTSAIRKGLGNVPRLDLPFVNGQLTGDVPQASNYDLTTAKKLLDDDGWKLDGSVRKKDGQALQLSVVTTKDSDLQYTLQTLVNQWQQLGITLTTTVVDPNDVAQNFVQSVLQPRAYDVLVYPLTIGGDPDVFAYWHSSQATANGFNFSNYSNPISDDALSTARARLEPDVRNTKYLIFARQWLSDIPAVGLYQSTINYVSSKTISGLPANSTVVGATDRYADVLYWSVGTRNVYQTP